MLILLGTLLPGLLSLNAFAASTSGAMVESGSEWLLPPVVAEGAPTDALGVDPVVPAREGKSQLRGSGSFLGSFRDQQALPVTDYGSPGTQTSVRGLGRTAEETDVQALGVPLNPAQGGGFDFGAFPQFLWSSYRFQLGPGTSGSDPRASSGTLSLVPWTLEALGGETSGWRLSQFYSGLGQNQISVGYKAADRAAVLAGWSEGAARGPSVSASARWGSGALTGKAHVLGTRIEADSPGSASSPTPNAKQLTARVIPVLQADWALAPDLVVKSSLFYDGTYLRYDNPDQSFLSADQVRQGGFNSAVLYRQWRFGLSLRQMSLEQQTFSAPKDTVGSVQVSRALDFSGTLVEPSVQLVGMSAQGVLPQFGLGARRELDGGWAAFSRLNFSRRFPSLMDRYYVAAPFFTGNPGLRPEKATTFSLGSELKARNMELSFQAYGQLRADAQITTGVSSPYNAGEARIGALIQNAAYTLTEGWTVLQGFTVTGSKLEATGREFPYMPSLLGQAGLQWSDTSGRGRWAADTFLRMEGARQTPGGQNLGGFAVWDLGARYRLVDATSRNDLQSLELIARIENISDRIYESVQDYPSAGRIISVAVVGEF